MKFLSNILVKAGLIVEGAAELNAATNTIYAGTGTRLRTEANNLVFERVSSSGVMKMIFAQGTISPSAKAYIGYSNATLNLILANEFSTAGLELRTSDIIRQQIFSNGNIVIGQASPVDAGYKIDISGTARISSTTTMTSLSGTGTRMVVADDNGVLSTQALGSGAITGSGTTNYLPKFTGASTLGNSGVFETSAGNVGIGTTSPLSATGYTTLAVNNTTGGNIDLMTGGVRVASWNNTSTETYFGTRTNTPLIFTTNATEVARFFNNGNFRVGANASDAGFRLDVNGTTRLNGVTSILGTSTSAYITTIRQTNTTSDVSFGLLVTAGTTANDVAFRVQNAAQNTNFFTVLGNGAATFSSSVVASGLVSAATEFRLNNHSFARIAILNTSGGIAGGYNLSLSSNVAQHDSTGNIAGYYYHNNGYIAFYTNTSQAAGTVATERMRLDAGGNIGVGVVPSAWSVLKGLQVGLTANLAGYTASTEGMFLSSNSFYNGGAFVYQVNGFATNYTQINGEHRWSRAASGMAGASITFSETMRMHSDGNVSIGSATNAGFKLDVIGTFRSSGATTFTAANNTADGGGQIYLNGATGNRIDFNINGVAAPTTTTRSAGTKIVLYPNVNATLVDYAIGVEGGAAWFSVPSNNAHAFKWYGGTTAQMTLTNGNLAVDTDTLFVDAGSNRVGIGIASATAKLHVLGSLGAFRVLDSGAEVHFSRDGNNDFLANGGTSSQLTIGANTNLIFETGTGLPEVARFNSAGSFGIGSTSLSGVNLRVSRNITGQYIFSGGSFGVGVLSDGTIMSDEVGGAAMFRSVVQTQAAAFNAGTVSHYEAVQSTLGAGSSIGSQVGFFARENIIGATNNFGFYGNIPSGTNRWNLYMNGTADNYMAGSLGIGTTALTGVNLYVLKPLTGSTQSVGVFSRGTIQSDVTQVASYFRSFAGTQAATFTLSLLRHFSAEQTAIGAGSTVSDQMGYYADSTLIGGTNNYGFYGNIASGTGRWNLYMNGTANNYMAGDTYIGGSVLRASDTSVRKLIVNGSQDGIGAEIVLTNETANDGASNAISFVGIRGAYGVSGQMRVTRRGIMTFHTQDLQSLVSPPERMRLDANGNLGLGTTTTTNRLEVWGASNVRARIVDTGGGTAGLILSSSGNTAYTIKAGNADNSLRIDQDGTDRITLASGGSVGIGSTSLAGITLRLSKNITGSTNGLGIYSDGTIISDVTSSVAYFQSVAATTAATFTLSNLRHFLAVQSTIGAGSTVTNQFGYAVGSSLIGATNNYGFYGDIPSGTNRWNLYMNGTALNYLNGSLLIGSTTDSGEKLQVTGTMKVTGASTFTATGASISMTTAGDTAIWSQVTNAGGTLYVGRDNAAGGSFGVANAHVIYGTAARPMVFFTNSAERMRIDSAGLVGIGVTPTVALDVAGASNVSSRARFAKTGTTKVLSVGADRDTSLLPYIGSESNHGFSIITNDVERARFDASGNLGLGVTPSAWSTSNFRKAIEVSFYGGISATNFDLTFTGGAFFNGTNYIYRDAVASTNYVQTSGQHRWFNAPVGTLGGTVTFTQAMTLDASGNLLVGQTSSTGERLQVAGSALITNSSQYTSLSATSGVFIKSATTSAMGVIGLTGVGFILQGATTALVSYPMLLQPYGSNVLIGSTTDSGERLQVNGTARISGASIFGGTLTVLTSSNARVVLDTASTDSSSRLQFNENTTIKALVQYVNSTFATVSRRNRLELGGTTGGISFTVNSVYDTPAVLIDGSGRVGIGTVTPATALDVSGSITVNTSGQGRTISTFYGANSDGRNMFIGGGGVSSVGAVGLTYQGSYNTSMGVEALLANTSGYYNVAVGYRSLYSNTTGYQNTGSGYFSLNNNTDGFRNVGFGINTLVSNTTGNNNTAIGFRAGGNPTNGNTTGSNNIFIGNDVSGVSATDSNRTFIGNASTTSTWLAGNLLLGSTTDSGERLQVTGDMKITGDLLISGTVSSAVNGDYSSNFSKTYAQVSAISNTNLYGLVSNVVFDLTNGAYSGSSSYNATALLSQASIAGNGSTISTQPIRGVMSGLVGKSGSTAMNLSDFRYFEAKGPDNGGVSGHVITDVYGMRIAALKGASSFTITNGWGIYQEGSTDNNHFNGKVLIGTATAGSSPVRISGLPTSSAGLSAGDLWNDAGTIKVA
jgi:hypothetical protein